MVYLPNLMFAKLVILNQSDILLCFVWGVVLRITHNEQAPRPRSQRAASACSLEPSLSTCPAGHFRTTNALLGSYCVTSAPDFKRSINN